MSTEGSKPDVFHSDDIRSEFLDDLPGQPVAPTSGLEGIATSRDHPLHRRPRMYNPLQRVRYAFRQPLAEFFGTLILVLMGDGVVAQYKLSSGGAGNYTTVALAWATAVFLGYGVSAGVSGAHLNPGVTLSAAIFRKFPWSKVPGYIFAQFFGGYIGALIMYGTYYQAINDFEGGSGIRTVTGDHASAGIFCTFSQSFLSTKGQVASEIVGSAVLQIGIFSLTDPHNAPLGDAFPFGLFILIFGIGSSYGYLTGYAINFARDFGPRLAATVGYGSELFTYGHHYFWVPMVIPVIGCLTGAFLYDLLIYEGHDSPLNQADFGFGEFKENVQSFQLSNLKPDFEIERSETSQA